MVSANTENHCCTLNAIAVIRTSFSMLTTTSASTETTSRAYDYFMGLRHRWTQAQDDRSPGSGTRQFGVTSAGDEHESD